MSYNLISTHVPCQNDVYIANLHKNNSRLPITEGPQGAKSLSVIWKKVKYNKYITGAENNMSLTKKEKIGFQNNLFKKNQKIPMRNSKWKLQNITKRKMTRT
jgi:hypothetical protein